MNTEEHKTRHELLHREFDELMADYLRHNDGSLPSKTSLIELAKWSHRQTIEPTDDG